MFGSFATNQMKPLAIKPMGLKGLLYLPTGEAQISQTMEIF